MVAWFVIIAVVPTILVAIFAVVTLNLGVQNWFSPAVRDALNSSVNVSQVYVNEHKANILVDISYIADNLQRDPSLFDEKKQIIEDRLVSRLDRSR